jgi:hypothetical protein
MRVRLLVAMLVLAVACGSRAESPGLAPSASPSPTPTPTSSPPPAPTAPPTLRPNPTAGPGLFTNVVLAYRVELPEGWRRSECAWNAEAQKVPVTEGFTSASIDEELMTDIGAHRPGVEVHVEENSAKRTALQWLESGRFSGSAGAFGNRYEKTSFDGKPDAARFVSTDGSTVHAIAVSARGQIYAIARIGQPTAATTSSQTSLLTSLHILSDVELSEAKATLASPAPAAARTAEEVADAMARGFAQKDTAALTAVAGACIWQGGEQSGSAMRPSSAYLANLQKAFAAGLTITVQPRPIEALANPQGDAQIRGTWKEAGQAQRSARFVFAKVGNTWSWRGVVLGL